MAGHFPRQPGLRLIRRIVPALALTLLCLLIFAARPRADAALSSIVSPAAVGPAMIPPDRSAAAVNLSTPGSPAVPQPLAASGVHASGGPDGFGSSSHLCRSTGSTPAAARTLAYQRASEEARWG